MNKKYTYLSILSCISAYCVVGLHANEVYWDFSTGRYWITAVIMEDLMYFAVPVFFMISSASLMDYRDRYTTKEFLKKRWWKAFFPYLVWSILGMLLTLFTTVCGTVTAWTPAGIWDTFIHSRENNTYWYFLPLFAYYLAIPIFSLIPKEKRIPIFKYAFWLTFIVNVTIPFAFSLLKWEFPADIFMGFSRNYLTYLFLGYLLHHIDFTKKQRILIYIAGILGLAIHIGGTLGVSLTQGSMTGLFDGYVTFPTVLYSAAVFVFIRYLKCPKWFSKFTNWFAGYTFATYLLHWYVQHIIVRIFLIDEHNILFRVFAPPVIIACCVGITKLVRLIPGVRKILP